MRMGNQGDHVTNKRGGADLRDIAILMATANCSSLTANYSYRYPAQSKDFVLAVKVVSAIPCLLSIVGASLIIITYAAFKNQRTRIRQLLVNLCVADILVAAFHFIGLFTNYDRFVFLSVKEALNASVGDWWCNTQAAFVMLGSIASFFWTTAIALYMFVVIVLHSPVAGKRLVYLFYPVCWGVPAIVTIVLGSLRRFGFDPIYGIGWCFLAANDSMFWDELIGYDLWTYIAIGLMPALYLATQCYIIKRRAVCCCRGEQLGITSGGSIGIAVADIKFILVPLFFILQRVWSFVVDILITYASEKDRCKFQQNLSVAVLAVLSDIGNSSQGTTNAILFIVFTKSVRKKLLTKLCCNNCRCSEKYVAIEDRLRSVPALEDTTELVDSGSDSLYSVANQSQETLLVPNHLQWKKRKPSQPQPDAMYRGL